MASQETLGLIDRFQQRFLQAHTETIRHVIEESRREAMADARAIIRHRTFDRLIAELQAEDWGDGSDRSDPLDRSHPEQPLEAAFDRRLEEEIGDMRAQIVRNHELLDGLAPSKAGEP